MDRLLVVGHVQTSRQGQKRWKAEQKRTKRCIWSHACMKQNLPIVPHASVPSEVNNTFQRAVGQRGVAQSPHTELFESSADLGCIICEKVSLHQTSAQGFTNKFPLCRRTIFHLESASPPRGSPLLLPDPNPAIYDLTWTRNRKQPNK